MYISLGSDCVIKKRMEEYYYHEKQMSQMFDWVLSDILAVSYILKNPEKISEEYFEIITKTIEGFYVIKHKLCYFISLHDAPISLTEYEAKKSVVAKYKRRLKRLIDLICTRDLNFIVNYDRFNPIYEGKYMIETKDVIEFFKVLNGINPLHCHTLCIITDSPEKLSLNTNRIRVIDSKEFLDVETMTNDWYRFFFDWENIIKKITLPITFPKYNHDQGALGEIP